MHRFHKFALLAVVALPLLALPSAVQAAGEQFGRIEGTVIDAASQVPVPGATIVVSGSQMIGGAKSVTTGDDGRYEVVGLPAGRYEVEISYAGVKPIKRRVVVRQGETAPLDVQWSAELAQAEVTVVVEERHMTKPDERPASTRLLLRARADADLSLALTRENNQKLETQAAIAKLTTLNESLQQNK